MREEFPQPDNELPPELPPQEILPEVGNLNPKQAEELRQVLKEVRNEE